MTQVIRFLTDSLDHFMTHSLTGSRAQSFIASLTHSLTQSLLDPLTDDMPRTVLMDMAGEQRGTDLEGCKDFYLKSMARIWP